MVKKSFVHQGSLKEAQKGSSEVVVYMRSSSFLKFCLILLSSSKIVDFQLHMKNWDSVGKNYSMMFFSLEKYITRVFFYDATNIAKNPKITKKDPLT